MSAAVSKHLLEQAKFIRDEAERAESSARHYREQTDKYQTWADQQKKLADEFEAAANAIKNV